MQEQLAETLGVFRQSISKWELDASAPEMDKLATLSDLFHVSLDQLVKGKAFETAAAGEIRIEEVARQNWYHRKMIILIPIRAFSIMLRMILGAVLCTLNSIALDIEYIL